MSQPTVFGRAAAVLGLLVLAITGCTRYEPLSLSGAGSMRVEVEVYKGPLTVPIGGQVGQLVSVLGDLVHATDDWRNEAGDQLYVFNACLSSDEMAKIKERGRTPPVDPDAARKRRTSGDCTALNSAYQSSEDVLKAACYILNTPTLLKTVGPAVYVPLTTCSGSNFPKHLEKYQLKLDQDMAVCQGKHEAVTEQLRCQGEIIGIAFDNLATLMRAAAFRVSDANIRRVPDDRRVRGLLVAFGFIASEYGNQLQARITVLQKQLALPHAGADSRAFREANTLPVSDYLRDAGRTDFIQLFDWMNATEPHDLLHPSKGKLDTQERIRMAQRLTADYYWQKVNEVYASGQGDVSMAFIKDDLGNWDLKSFSNDPGKLLASYRKVTDAVLKSTAKLVARAASGGGSDALFGAASAAGLANQLATGTVPGTPATVGGLDVAALHARAVARLQADKARFDARGAAANDAVSRAQQAKDAFSTELARLEETVKARHDAAVAAPDDADARNAEGLAVASRDAGKTLADRAEDALRSAKQHRADVVRNAVDTARRTLDDHLAVVGALQDGIAGPAPPAAAGASPRLPSRLPARLPFGGL